MSDISLTASMRSNLLSLQGTADLMGRTQERLSSGKKVNSAIDNPSSFYTARALNNRAGDLSALLDNMGQAVSTIKAANEGIESITSFVEQAKAVANSAIGSSDADTREKYQDQFNELIKQINNIASDAGYKGVNLIGGEGTILTVAFNEITGAGQSKLEISSRDATATGLGLSEAQNWGSSADVSAEQAAVTAAQTALATAQGEYDTAAASAIDVSTAITGTASDVSGHEASHIKTDAPANSRISFGGKYYQVGTAIEATTETALSDLTELVQGNDGKYYTDATTANAKYTALTSAQADLTSAQEALTAAQANDGSAQIQKAIDEATRAINKLRDMSSEFGNNYAIVETRENFTTSLINVLEEGADKLTLADMNEESANMLALQTRQQLAINSLSLASQSAQSVLKLFS